MLMRLMLLLGLQMTGAALGAWCGGFWGALLGAIGAACCGFAWDAWRATQVLAWLRHGQSTVDPQLKGPWGEVVDRTRRLLREQSRRVEASEQRLQAFLAALQAAPNGVLLLDASNHIEWCNQMAAQHFGLEMPRDHLQFIAHLLREPSFSAYLTAGNFANDVLLQGRKSTAERPVRLAVRLYAYGDGKHLMLSRDITALEQAEAMRRDFVANVSHEIRTPLTVLSGFVETLQTLPLDEPTRAHYLDLMAQQGRRMRDLVQDLLALSRLEGSPAPGLYQWTPLSELLQRCIDEAQALSQNVLPANSTPHRWDVPTPRQLATLGDIAGSSTELYSALSNLMSNAVRYTPAGQSISMTWHPQNDGTARFCVRDSGPGMAPEHVLRVTERFYRISQERAREDGGTGLGLAIVKHVAQRHGALLEIRSTLGQGSEFALIFPAERLRPTQPEQQQLEGSRHASQ